MTEDEIARYASATAQLIGLRGEPPRANVVAMLRALELSASDADEVITYGLANGFFVATPEGRALRAALGAPPAPSKAAPGDASAPSKATPGDASAPGRAAPGDYPAPRGATPGDVSAPGRAAPGDASARGGATPGDASAPGRATPGDAPAPRGAAEQGAAAAWPDIEAALYRAIRDSIPAAIWAVDMQGVFIHHEGKGLAAAGIKPGQFVGKNIFDLYSGTDGIDAIRVAFTGEVGHTVDEQHAVFWESWYIPVRDARGAITMVAGVTLDVSAAKRAERELLAKFDLIENQRQMINALSTPIIEVWDKVLTVPMLGVIDSERAARVMTSLLERVAATGARVAILDLTGIEAMDAATAVHMLKLIQSIRLLGAEGIITGIRPSVAQTMVALGLDLGSIVTRASLRDGLQFFMTQMREEGARRS